LRASGADILEGPVVRVYGQRELVIKDCNGLILAFGEDTSRPVTNNRLEPAASLRRKLRVTTRRSTARRQAPFMKGRNIMGTIVRNVVAVVLGLVVGSIVNMGLIMVGSQVIPPPEGVDVTNMESLRSSMHLFEPKHFLFPFLAHALGTLAGAFAASLIAATQRMKLALGASAFFLLGGVINVFLLPSPIWFAALDLIGAYIPMGWVAGKLAESLRPAQSQVKSSAHKGV